MEIAFPNPGGDEVGQLIDAFNALLSRLQENSRRMIEHERNEKYAMRLALQYQMNPHFLFNSLNWIQMSTELGVEREQISEAILLLGKLLRNNLQGSAMTTLDEEARCAQDYVRLMNMRKQDFGRTGLAAERAAGEPPVMRFLSSRCAKTPFSTAWRRVVRCTSAFGAGRQARRCIWSLKTTGAMIPPDKLAMLRLQTPRRWMSTASAAQPLGAPAACCTARMRRWKSPSTPGNHEHRNHLPPAHAGGNSGGNGQRKG